MPVRSVKFSPSGRILYTASDDGRVLFYDTSALTSHSASIASLIGHASWVLTVDASPDEVHIATGSSDKLVKIWDTRSKEAVHTFEAHSDQVWSVAFNPDGTKLASVGDDARLQLYTVQ
jgi:WD repeat-containing protein 61